MKKLERKFSVVESESVPKSKIVKVKAMNNVVEVQSMLCTSNGLNGVLKLSKDEYMLLATGEVKNYIQSENRGQNIAGLKKTFRKIRDLINNNFVGAENELHITTTYGENMTDTKRLYADCDRFWKRYKYKYPDAEYITIVEPQGRGAWHNHWLIKHKDRDKIFVPHDELAKMWGHGFVKIKSMFGVDNLGAYLSAYLGDIELNEENMSTLSAEGYDLNGQEIVEREVKDETGKKNTKRFIKGARCYLYPVGMNIYRKSRGIVHPVTQEMTYQQAKKIVGNVTPNYSKTVEIRGGVGELLNRITYEQYNTHRNQNQ